MCCSHALHAAHCGGPAHTAHRCHPSGSTRGCAGHRPAAHVMHHGCCSQSQEDKLAWLEHRLQGLKREATAVEEQIAALQGEQAQDPVE